MSELTLKKVITIATGLILLAHGAGWGTYHALQDDPEAVIIEAVECLEEKHDG